MESQHTTTSGPSLSQYFGNDPPSFFDEIARNQQEKGGISADNCGLDARFQATQYLERPDSENEIQVPDDVRNFWEPSYTTMGIPPLLTTPGVMISTDLTDPIREATFLYFGGTDEVAQRKILTADDVTQDERGLRTLTSAGCYRSAVSLCGRLLTIYGQGYGRAGQPAKHSPHSLQLWFTRLALLVKLGQYELLNSEAEAFGQLNKPDLYYEFYPEMHGGKKGSMVAFSFRLLLAEVPIYSGDTKIAMDRLTGLLEITTEIKTYYKKGENLKAYEFWRRREIRVIHSIINCAIFMKDFSLVDEIIKKLFTESELTKEEKRSLFSSWGRIYLQIGDVFGAEQKFSEARRLREMNSSPDLRDYVDKGLIAVAQNDFQEAYINFQKALSQDSTNTMLLNNMGVCLLYSGKLKSAIKLFEEAIKLNPQIALNESLLINLSTLYELESSNSKDKKLNLLKLLNRFKPDLNISLEYCLKLQGI